MSTFYSEPTSIADGKLSIALGVNDRGVEVATVLIDGAVVELDLTQLIDLTAGLAEIVEVMRDPEVAA